MKKLFFMIPWVKTLRWLLAETGWQRDVAAWLAAENEWYFKLAAQVWSHLSTNDVDAIKHRLLAKSGLLQ